MEYDCIKKILLVRTDGIGDALNSTPAISALRKTYPNAQISIVVRQYGADILSHNPDIDEIIVYNSDKQHKGLMNKLRFFMELRSKKFDTAIALQNSSFCNFITFISGAKIRIGRKSEPKRFCSTLTHWINQSDPKGTKHEIDRNFDLLRFINVKNGSKDLILRLSDSEKAFADNFLLKNSLASNDSTYPLFRLIGIHPGGSSIDKMWLPESFAWIADNLIEKFKAKVILFYGHNEDHLAKNILSKMKNMPILASKISLRQLCALIERCSLFICNDSGPMHIASAFKIPTVAIFGPTDYVRWRPQHERAVIVRKDMNCFPCSAHKCKKNYECTKTLPIYQVWDAIIGLI
ncbi:MAG: lipopolysaccharide heptosyltransferase II [Candidatus Poribacteria bacterium]